MTNKLLGQNWLINPKIHETIIEAAEISSTDMILEVGPGTGLLTKPLAQTGAKILAVEKDLALVKELEKQFEKAKNVTIIPGDILKFNPQDYQLQTINYKLLGNIPYYLTSHLIKLALEKWPRPERLILMVQKEVAQRLLARPPRMNLLGLSVQFYADVQLIRLVSKGNFRPIPKVNSAIIKIIPQELSVEQRAWAPVLFKIARAGFSGRRKQLVNSLSTGLGITKEKVEAAMVTAKIEGRRRPETLTLPEWLNLSSSLSSLLPVD